MFTSAIIIDARKDVRTAVRSALKELGITQCQNAESTKEALQILSGPESLPGWIIARVEAEDISAKTSYDLLLSLIEVQKFAHIRVSLLYDEEQGEHLPPLFEMGVLSAHKGPFTQQSLTSEFKLLLESIQANKPNTALVAGHYLRDYLSGSENYSELLALEKSLFASFPKNQQVILHHIEAMYMSGDTDGAKSLLRQAKYLGKDIQIAVKQLADLLEVPEVAEGSNENFALDFGIKHCMIVDSDSISATQVETLLLGLGVSKISIFGDGKKALEYMNANADLDLIIQEWRFPSISGPQLLQRIRRERRFLNPVIVISSLLKQEDMLLLNEMGADCVVVKPINSDDFIKSLTNCFRQSKFPGEAKEVARQIRVAIEANKYEEARSLYKTFLAFKEIPEGIRLLVDGEIAYINKDFAQAKKCAMESIKHKGESLVGLNILGKSLMKLGDSKSAEKVFTRANQMNPKNIERLCLLAESLAETGSKEAAADTINLAKSIDPTNGSIQEVAANIALVGHDTEAAKKIMKDMSVFTGVVAYMNNRAVILAKDGKWEEGAALYQSALDALPVGNFVEEGVLLYNLGLTLLRQNKLVKAIVTLSKINRKHGAAKAETAGRLIQNAQAALNKNTSVHFAAAAPSVESLSSLRPIAFHAKPGELGLHHIYSASAFEEERFQKYLKSATGKVRQKA